jgi:hypothetical protein
LQVDAQARAVTTGGAMSLQIAPWIVVADAWIVG